MTKYKVLAGRRDSIECKTLAVKESMDDALDLIQSFEDMDKEEGFYQPDYYAVMIVKGS